MIIITIGIVLGAAFIYFAIKEVADRRKKFR